MAQIRRPRKYIWQYKGIVFYRHDVYEAMRAFHRKYPNSNDYNNWWVNGNYDYALVHEGQLYPTKWIMAWIEANAKGSTEEEIPTILGTTDGTLAWKALEKARFDVKDKKAAIGKYGIGQNKVNAPTRLIEAEAKKAHEKGEFDPKDIEDERTRTSAAIVLRRGQPEFRNALLTAYERRCPISGYDAEEALEAAHIIPYSGEKANHPQNGLLLRADLHVLFDRGLIAVDSSNMTILIHSSLEGTRYEELRGTRLTLPLDPHFQPSNQALDEHRTNAGL